MRTAQLSVRFTADVTWLVVLSASLLNVGAPARAASQQAPDRLQRGRYLVSYGGCSDCHTPKAFTAQGPVPDTSRLLAGSPAETKIPTLPAGALGPDQW